MLTIFYLFVAVVLEEKIIDEGPKEQLKFDCALQSACLLVCYYF